MGYPEATVSGDYEVMNMIGGTITTPAGRLIWREGSGCTVEIYDIEVDSAYRRKGIGKKLVAQLVNNHVPPGCQLVYAITRTTNLIAQEFYEGVGFRVIAVLRNFYKDEFGERNVADAIMFGIDIVPAWKGKK